MTDKNAVEIRNCKSEGGRYNSRRHGLQPFTRISENWGDLVGRERITKLPLMKWAEAGRPNKGESHSSRPRKERVNDTDLISLPPGVWKCEMSKSQVLRMMGVNEPSRARIPPSSARARLSCCRLELELGSFKVWYPSSSSAREKCKKLELGLARLDSFICRA
ncbi:hypothetical protein LXL04_030946 [Taraxacum kok-saghyz]